MTEAIPNEWKRLSAEELIGKALEITGGKGDKDSKAISDFLRWALQRLKERSSRQHRNPDATL